jgi:hypothetical protein
MQLLLAATPVRRIMSFVIQLNFSLGIVNVAARMEQQMTLAAMQDILIAKITGVGTKHSAATAF